MAVLWSLNQTISLRFWQVLFPGMHGWRLPNHRHFPADAPPLLPYKDQGGPGGFHIQIKDLALTPEQAGAIIQSIGQIDPRVARLRTLMLAAGLRVTEVSYLHTRDIQVEAYQRNNANCTKGRRPRVMNVDPRRREFLEQLK